MLGEAVREVKAKVNAMLQIAVWGAVAAGAGLAGFLFFLVALFVWTAENYDTVTACITLGTVLALLAAIAAAIAFVVRQRDGRSGEKRKANVSASAFLFDPVIVATGLNIVRTLGGRRTAMLMLGALATTWLLAHSSSANAAARRPPPEQS